VLTLDQPADILRYAIPRGVTTLGSVPTGVTPGSGSVGVTPGSVPKGVTPGSVPIGVTPGSGSVGITPLVPLGSVQGNSSSQEINSNKNTNSDSNSIKENDNKDVKGSEGLLTESKVRYIMGKRIDFSRDAVAKVKIVIK
jgi:hypothetical protein